MGDSETNAVVIGGTGMLSEATDWLVGSSRCTLLIARRATRAARGNPKVLPLDIDWSRPGFEEKVTGAVRRLHPISRALIWLHDPQPALIWLIPILHGARTVVVLGSTDGRPIVPTRNTDCVFVQLGSKATASGRRWLSHPEISAAAIDALRDGKSLIVGDLQPLL